MGRLDPTIAIIGAGLAGLTLAHRLPRHTNVTVFEKSRGIGGRMATRYADEFEFDHGAQFFTARSASFREFLQPLLRAGAVAIWRARFVELERDRLSASHQWDDRDPHFVGAPRMNSIGASLADGLRICRNTAVARLRRTSAGWHLDDSAGRQLGRFDWVIVTTPPAQAANLAPPSSELRRLALSRQMRACFAVMLGFEAPLSLDWDAARVSDADISWISVNSSKPGRGDASTMVVHSTNAWADHHLESGSDQVLRHLLAETSAIAGFDVQAARHVALHRWRYAHIGSEGGLLSFFDAGNQLAACGDWFVRGRVEAAYTSADDLAEKLLPLLAI